MNSRPTPVAFIVNSLRFGGAEKHTIQLLNGLAGAGFMTTLAYLKREEHLLQEAQDNAAATWCGEFGKGWDFSGLMRLAKWLNEKKPEILFCVNTYSLFYGHLARLISRHNCQIFAIYHSTNLSARDAAIVRWVYQPFFNHSDRIIYVSHTQRAHWEANGLRRNRGLVIHNGVDVEKFRNSFSPEEVSSLRAQHGFKRDDFVVGICAALRPEKGHEDLMAAVSALKREGVPAKCLIIGDGPRRHAIEASIASLNLQSDVVVTGFQADTRPYVAACDCMALVSHQETFSIAALESMAMEKPIVMSSIGGAAEQIQEGENGYLFPPADIPALAAALHKLTDRQHCIAMGRRAREIAIRKFGIEHMLEQYAQLIESTGKR